MNIVNIIAIILTAISIPAGLFHLIEMIEGKKSISIPAILAYITVVLLFFITATRTPEKQSYINGYQQAIMDASLTEVTNDGYTLEFNGEYHNYSFD